MYGYGAILVGIKALERLELSLSNNVLNEAKRLNVWNDLDPFLPVASRLMPTDVLQFDKRTYPGKVVKVIGEQEPPLAKKS